jgi:hypothetical protein
LWSFSRLTCSAAVQIIHRKVEPRTEMSNSP